MNLKLCSVEGQSEQLLKIYACLSGWSDYVNGLFRLTRKERITHPSDFRKVMKSGRKISSKSFVLFGQPNKIDFHRLGIVVKKEVGPATFRNRIKRYCRESFRLHKREIKGAYDIVILVKKGCSVNRFLEAEQELKGLFPL